ncbi:interleukin-3 [Vulpes vulpes]|uniref:Interleukin-3 n=1 Tax=Vulpes vulpes TaxID=9627 RepID=A0ABM4YC73_VULVU
MEVPCQIKILPIPCSHRGVGTVSGHKRQDTVLDASERHKGPGRDRLHPVSLNMSSFPILHLLLLLLGCQAPQAQGRPFSTHLPKQYFTMINEIMETLNKSPSPSEEPLDSNEKETLLEDTLLRPNLDVFLNASSKFDKNGLLICNNLKEFLPLLPTPTPRGEPISIMENNWGDFQRKLKKYLEALDNFLNFKNKP